MKNGLRQPDFANLPVSAIEYIKLVIKKMRWKKKVREDVQAELIAHFEDALRNCKTNEEKEKAAKELIANFGDAELIAVLARRAKKRCRPMWQKMLINSLQLLGIIFVYIVICWFYVNWGEPNISVNYVQWLNNYVRQGRDESLNSPPLIKEAAKLVVPMPKWLNESEAAWPSDLNDIQMHKLEEWLASNYNAIEGIKKACNKPYYWNFYDTNDPELGMPMWSNVKFTILDFSKYRKLAEIIDWQVRYSAYKNNLQEAVNNTIVLCKFGHNFEGNGILNEQLGGIGIEARGYHTVFDILNRTDLSLQQLADLQGYFQKTQNDKMINFEAEKVFLYDFVQRNFTDDDNGSGKPIRDGILLGGNNWFHIIWNILIFNLPDKRDILEKAETLYETYGSFRGSIYTDAKEKYEEDIHDTPIWLQLYVPSFEKINAILCRYKTQRDALITTLAIMRFQKETGKYPQTLDELLQTGHIKQIPFDVYRNGPLTYKRTDINFTLYSFGVDGDDDGGKMGMRKGKPFIWDEKDGDAVFGPVTESKQ
jgi:hypothetical protein